MSHALTLITFVPIAGMVLILALPDSMKNASKWIAVAATIPQLLIAIHLYENFDTTTSAVQFAEKASWMPSYHISYFMGVDGISISMVLLTALIMFIATFASFGINRAEKGYYAMLLMLDTGMMGVFVSLDFFLFYIFWEVMLLPMYFLIGIWGGPRREYAAIKFFLYTLLGSVLILLAMLGLYYYSATPTFDLTELAANSSHYSIGFQRIVWIALFIGFAIKIPAFPFHTWLPDAHVEAPTAISVILAGVLLKMGTYGILRVNFAVLPAATYQLAWVFLGVIGTINIVYGAMCAMAQTDYKKLIAYSSISHMGYVMLGMAAFTTAGINGAVLQMFNHGTITAMLFILVGVIYDRAHHREINGFGGLAQQMPIYTAFTGFAFFAGMGLPGMSAFISEVLVLLGAWQTHPFMVVFGAATAVLTAGYLLWTFQRIYLGPLNEKYKGFSDLSFREAFTLVPLGVIVLILGVYPHAILGLLNTSLVHLNQVVLSTSGAAVAMVR
ncbi:MAG: NADH-quinone oxidoreductase subunit M [Candidatus Binatus sp.]|jgi:NADH-quinone oxidoreductase subunit M|uniref:complex I subunit 4 family protein n=1 Tax=Candidatus Binatus sp. TaxID=2811406 RepID=UPI003C9E7D73